LQSLEARVDRPFVVALGDFNTSLELSRVWSDRAIVSGGAADPSTDGLVVFPGRAAAEETRLPGAVWDPWETVTDPPGSYYYQGDWNRLDHTFVATSSLRLADWAFSSFRVVAYAPQPQAYGPRTPNGVSDHFPLVLTLERRSSSPSP
jgi:endonuclease/exonuclease/phosphatase family metal-dependent hydrolase